MGDNESAAHWEKVYQQRAPHEVSWTQDIPVTSLELIRACRLPADAPILDMGGGDSKLADHLLLAGYSDITVVDISAKALEKAQQRLGAQAARVKWIVADILAFTPPQDYLLWHDRAVFHFMTTPAQQEQYLAAVRQAVRPGGYAITGTFSLEGPEKCSGLPVQRYSCDTLTARWQQGFTKISCLEDTHTTPFNTSQYFTFCSFSRYR
ncbi:class I SAM-dependent methyltransferase [Chitinophaga nivalis]|uniref:Class I SAM-dependent methyltransferase n=1 Tax=Chitinophaga nivalis TaxID=2991709 RepID=A0ABT3ILF4_9BACT|nr:class I SAM-dependent methyltransferase [Chitinophaga nivalis]MCW3465516.1 class I SAM-dependent methyltransferase [Chitinophaga nivalis]MCW3484793.1 class I SAM-dependent methyltransferase [Chitinophaga nivalis]